MTATAPEISKSDFFDFVTSNEVTDAQYKQQMRSVNVFTESSDSKSNPLLSDEPKEQNNNSLLSISDMHLGNSTNVPTTSTTLQSFDSIWNVERDRERLESAMLEDLSKYYWNQDNENNSSSHSCNNALSSNRLTSSNNTDGQIYTLTVLNHDMNDNASRYWTKEDEASISSPTDIEQQSTLDLESILNMNGFPNEFNQDTLNPGVLPKVENYEFEDEDVERQNMHKNNLIKIEPYDYEDNNFQRKDHNEESKSPLVITPMLEGQVEFNNNNNDWKLTNQNSESNESLLRSALQGKTFIRYSTVQKNIKLEPINTEMKNTFIVSDCNKSNDSTIYQESKNPDTEILMAISPQNGNLNISILLDNPSTTATSNENTTSAQNVDDILLSQLDANYPEEDYEKLKRIATELGESVQPFCTVEAIDPTHSMYNIHHLDGELVTMIPAGDVHIPQHLQLVAGTSNVNNTKSTSKKYKRIQNKISTTLQSPTGTAIQPATSTSNGVRKERSLHYCSICSKGFKDKYSVNVHVRTHTGEKPFSCSLCGKSFRQKAHLAKHYQTHIAQKSAANNSSVKPNKQR